MKVLVSAYACEPERGSEPGVGWNWVRQISRFHSVWVITRANNREAIGQALARDPLPRVHWIFFDLPRMMRFWKRGPRGVQLYYYLWQIGIYPLARRLQRQIGFDVVHHVTFVNWWIPSFLVYLGVPFVWGPVGGGESAPLAFARDFPFRGRVYERLRDVGRWMGERNPFVRNAARLAALTLATTDETARILSRFRGFGVTVVPTVGLTATEIASLEALPLSRPGPFRVASIGRLIHWKGVHLGLRAFAEIQGDVPDTEYWIIGDGPERGRLERMAQHLGVARKVRFLGALPRHEILDVLGACDVLVYPSLHDSGGWISLEAMAAGRPVICLRLGGPALQVTEGTGIRVPADDPDQAVGDMAAALRGLALNPDARMRMGRAARERVRSDFCWDAKGEWIQRAYEQILSGRPMPRSSIQLGPEDKRTMLRLGR